MRLLVLVESGGRLAMMGAQDVVKYISRAKMENPNLNHTFGVFNMLDGRKKLCRITAAAMPQYFAHTL